MPALNFKSRFAPAVELGLANPLAPGAKRCTIRATRKRPICPGDRLSLYTGMRTKACRKLGEAECRTVDRLTLDIQIAFPSMVGPEDGAGTFIGDMGTRYTWIPVLVFTEPATAPFLGRSSLCGRELQVLADYDGFASVAEFTAFFRPQKGAFQGSLITW